MSSSFLAQFQALKQYADSIVKTRTNDIQEMDRELEEKLCEIKLTHRDKRIQLIDEKDEARNQVLEEGRVLLKRAIDENAPLSEIQGMIRAHPLLVFDSGKYRVMKMVLVDEEEVYFDVYTETHLERIVEAMNGLLYLPMVAKIFHRAHEDGDVRMWRYFLKHVYTPYLVCLSTTKYTCCNAFNDYFRLTRQILAMISPSLVPRLCETGLGKVPEDMMRQLFLFLDDLTIDPPEEE